MGAIERLLRGVGEAALAIVVAVGDDEGDAAGDYGRAHLLDGALCEGLDLLWRLVAECGSVALDLVAGQDDEVGPLCVKCCGHQRERIWAYGRHVLDVSELHDTEGAVGAETRQVVLVAS